MPVTITVTKNVGGFNEANTWNWDDATVDRLIAWAKTAYPNADGSPVGNAAAIRRWARGLVQGTRDNIRNTEKAAAVAAVADPSPIDVTP